MTTPTPEEARAALEPLVAYCDPGFDEVLDTLRRFIDAHSAPVQPEPVAWISADYIRKPAWDYKVSPVRVAHGMVPLYASPPPAQPPREVLTDEQIEAAMYGCLNDWDWREFARAIERLVRGETDNV